MQAISFKEYPRRRVIICVENPTEPEWVHMTATGPVPHTDAASVNAAGVVTPGLAAGTECHACRSNWRRQEFVFDLRIGETGMQPLNRFGYPPKGEQAAATYRPKRWTELCADIEGILGQTMDKTLAPAEPAPLAAPEPEYYVEPVGMSTIINGFVVKDYAVFRAGVRCASFHVAAASRQELLARVQQEMARCITEARANRALLLAVGD